jgi:hypothetical protein
MDITPDTVVHRIGGGSVERLRLSTTDLQQSPPGISVLLGGTPEAAADLMRRGYPTSKKWARLAGTVASTTAVLIRQAGFDVISAPTDRFPNHGRIVHSLGIVGFGDDQLGILSQAFTETTGC